MDKKYLPSALILQLIRQLQRLCTNIPVLQLWESNFLFPSHSY